MKLSVVAAVLIVIAIPVLAEDPAALTDPGGSSSPPEAAATIQPLFDETGTVTGCVAVNEGHENLSDAAGKKREYNLSSGDGSSKSTVTVGGHVSGVLDMRQVSVTAGDRCD